MDQHRVELLREEALRLLEVVVDMLQRMKGATGVVVDELDNEHPTFTPSSIEAQLRMLAGEQSKLKRLEMMLAVVGTMKAGKSTTINAIVGAEVLPNRNRPMTALPTRIRHLQGQHDPILSVSNTQPLDTVMATLRRALNTQAGLEFTSNMRPNKDMSALVAEVKRGQKLRKRYEGAEEIYGFLRNLNDLVRMCFDLKVDFPFDAYKDIDNIPLIEIEFAHLAQLPPGVGSFTLLDTPGPNEADQQHLRVMLRDQLKHASAVMAVLDYTQLGSDADDEIRQELRQLSDVAEGRMYALVNKIDEKNRNSDSIEETRALVASMLASLPLANIFPVASKLADLSNRAKRALAEQGALPRPTGQQNDWVTDFGNLAFGALWDGDDLLDKNDVLKRADKLWKNSRFADPLTQVVEKAHAQAAVLAISAAGAKLKDISHKLNNFLDIREIALGKGVAELSAEIDALQDDVQTITELQADSRERSDRVLSEIKTSIFETFVTVREAISEEIERGFNAAKDTERAQTKEIISSRIRPFTFVDVAKALWGGGHGGESGAPRGLKKKPKFGRDFDPSNPIIKLNTEASAREVTEGIEEGVREIIQQNEARLHRHVDRELERFKVEFDRGVSTHALQLLEALGERFDRQGFSIDLQLPELPSLALKMSSRELLENAIAKKQRNRKRRRRAEGVWGTVCGWFDSDDWGWETYTEVEGYYEVDINQVASSINSGIETMFNALESEVAGQIEQPLEAAVDTFFDQLRELITQLSSDISQSIRDKQSSHEQQVALGALLSEFKRHVPGLREDCGALLADARLPAREATK